MSYSSSKQPPTDERADRAAARARLRWLEQHTGPDPRPWLRLQIPAMLTRRGRQRRQR